MMSRSETLDLLMDYDNMWHCRTSAFRDELNQILKVFNAAYLQKPKFILNNSWKNLRTRIVHKINLTPRAKFLLTHLIFSNQSFILFQSSVQWSHFFSVCNISFFWPILWAQNFDFVEHFQIWQDMVSAQCSLLKAVQCTTMDFNLFMLHLF
jgi:5,10-methylenetetrahydrofolate reductase